MALRLCLFDSRAHQAVGTLCNRCWKMMYATSKVQFRPDRRLCLSVPEHGHPKTDDGNDSSDEGNRTYRVADFPDLELDKTDKERMRLLLRQHKLRLRHGLPAPQELSTQNVLDLLAKDSFNKRCRLFKYLFHKEQKRLREERRVLGGVVSTKAAEPKSKKEFVPHSADRIDEYRLFGNSFLIRIRAEAINRFYESRQIPAILFGQSVVFDLAYDEIMTPRECNKAARDLLLAYGWNRTSRDPFHLHFCNAAPNGVTAGILENALFSASELPLLSELTPHSYLDVFPKEKLVYLTPDSENTLDVFDHDAVYVIGALVDKETKPGVTLSKATSEGLRTARFPQTFAWNWQEEVAQPLHFPDVLKILLDLKRTNSWESALKFVNRVMTVRHG